GADPDLLVAELRVTENTARRLDEWFVGAIVVAEGVSLRRGSDGFEVGVDIPAAEGVDRLLRVADEDEVALAVEGGLEDPPLRVVRVLELVDEHHLPAFAHPGAAGSHGAHIPGVPPAGRLSGEVCCVWSLWSRLSVA